jgi:hypothetical protein
MNNFVTYFFGFINDLATNQELGKLVGIPLFLRGGSVDLLAEPHNALEFFFFGGGGG